MISLHTELVIAGRVGDHRAPRAITPRKEGSPGLTRHSRG
jgi:hypothetical protein